MKIVENVSRRNLGEGKLQYRLSSLSNHNSNINNNNNENNNNTNKTSSNSNPSKIKKNLVSTTVDNNESLRTADNFYFVASSSLPDLDLRHQAGLEQHVNKKSKKSKHRDQLSSSLFAYPTK